MNNKDKNDEVSYENTDNYTHIHKAEVDCKYTKTGRCDDCTRPENDICPYEAEFK